MTGAEVAAGPSTSSAEPLLRTPLYPFHVAHRAHMVPFAGWEMPLYYQSILTEHDAVRHRVGLFDVSHMGILSVEGPSSPALLSRRTTANIDKLEPGQCRYTFWLDLVGAILDDLLITRFDDGKSADRSYLVVPNASRTARIIELLHQHRYPTTTVEQWNDRVAILAVQGPGSRDLLERVLGWKLDDLGFYRARLFPLRESPSEPFEGQVGMQVPASLERAAWVSRTGYTGELGYELFVSSSSAVAIADQLVDAGAVACGLGARDTLRLEKGFLLSGQDFNRDRTPLEAGQDRFIDFDHLFVGREALEKVRAQGPSIRLSGLTVLEPGAIPRHGTPVLHDGQPVTTVTSGGLSPTLRQGIALAYLPPELAAEGTRVEVEVRGRRAPAEVVPLPFVQRPRARR